MKSANRMHVAGPTTTPEKTTVEIKFSLNANPIKIVLTASICFDYLHVMSSHFSLSLSTYLHCVHMR